QSRPMALRRIRPGYLYLWQEDGPLRRFVVADDGRLTEQSLDDDDSPAAQGELAGLKLNKASDVWLAYTEIPLPPHARERLENSATRQRHMRRMNLPRVARELQAEHCPPLDKAEQLLAELMPDSYDKALAADHIENAEQQDQTLDQVYATIGTFPTAEQNAAAANAWLQLKAQRDKSAAAADRHPDASEAKPGKWSAVNWDAMACEAWLDLARRQAGELHAVFAALDDRLGVLR